MTNAELNEMLFFDRKHIWHPYATMTNPPPVNYAVGAEGVNIELADGSKLIDAISSWWCVCHGHRHPKIMAAMRAQSEKLAEIMFAGFTHEPAIRLTEKLIRRTPAGLNRVFYVDSGSVSVEAAMKMAVHYQLALGRPGRNRMASIKGGYHGDTTGAMSVSDPDGMHQMFGGLLVKHFFAPRPEIPYDGDWVDSDFAPMRKMLEEHSEEIAGVIVEPIFQGGNGMRFYHPQYLKCLRKACDDLGLLLLFDEIATGFGRLGTYFASDLAGVVPDIMCVGKGITGGSIGLSAVIASDKVADTISASDFNIFPHGPTFTANPLACAAGCASLDLFEEYDWAGNVHRIQEQLKAELAELKNHPKVQDVRVLGAVGVVEMKQTPSPETAQEVILRNGVWVRPFENWVYTMPPFITTPEEITRITTAIKDMVDADCGTGQCYA